MRKTKSAILEAVHDTAKDLHKARVMDQITLREFDRLCLPPVEPLKPAFATSSRLFHCRPNLFPLGKVHGRLLQLAAMTAPDMPGAAGKRARPGARFSVELANCAECRS